MPHQRRWTLAPLAITAACVSTTMVPFQVESEPPGGNVEVNGVLTGKTPCEIKLGMTERWVGLAYAPGGWQKESPFYNVTVFPPHGTGQTCYSQTKSVQPSATPNGAKLYFDLRLVPVGAVRQPDPPSPSVAPEATTSNGTAFLVAPGHAVTAHHVVEGSQDVWIYLRDGERVAASIVASDPTNDLCLLKLAKQLLERPLWFAEPGSLQAGERIFLLGFPLAGILDQQDASITDGLVSGMTGLQGEVGRFQITAATNAGNSGGPVVDASGNVVGVLLSSLSPYYMMARHKTIPQGVNFAVRGDIVVAILSGQGATMQTAKDAPDPMDAASLHAVLKARVMRVAASKKPQSP